MQGAKSIFIRLIQNDAAFKQVSSPSPDSPEPEKVRQLFDRLAYRYDFFNRCASLGLDRRWRRSLITAIRKNAPRPARILDLGTGTGDLVLDLARAGTEGSCIGLDLSGPMLDEAKRKLGAMGTGNLRSGFVQGSAAVIPLDSECLDAAMSAFVLRNVKKLLPQVLSEIERVLRPGGSVFFLEMYAPSGAVLSALHKVYLQMILPAIGKAVFGGRWSGGYLAETILGFGTPDQFSELLRIAGFEEVECSDLYGGIAAVHRARKPLKS